MRKFFVTPSQLYEALDQIIDKKPGETLDSAIKSAAQKAQQEAPNVDVNFVVPKDEVNEEDEIELEFNDDEEPKKEQFVFTKKQVKESRYAKMLKNGIKIKKSSLKK